MIENRKIDYKSNISLGDQIRRPTIENKAQCFPIIMENFQTPTEFQDLSIRRRKS